MIVTRFAPSPTGHLHLGHAYSALVAEQAAREAGGKFLLRIEDIDPVRCKPQFTEDLMEDLYWLGVRWEEPVRRQSAHMQDYIAAWTRLREMDLLYPCFCTRGEIAAEIAAAGHAPQGPDGLLYVGTCRALSSAAREERMASEPFVWRLDMKRACAMVGRLTWHDCKKGQIEAHPEIFGDVVLVRKDTPTSYHLSVTVDDHLQGVTLVTRGVDLLPSTSIHRLLQKLLGYDSPTYDHHALLLDEGGQRLAKRNKSVTLREIRRQGVTPQEIRCRIPPR